MNIAIHWFRQDLRVSDNPALTLAARHERVLPIYILDNENAGEHAMGGASEWWLHHSLQSLNASLGGALSVYQGNPIDILNKIIARHDINAVGTEPGMVHRTNDRFRPRSSFPTGKP